MVAAVVKPKRVALYLRVSTSGQTIENQRRELLAVARRHKWNVTDVFKDEGVSGAKGRADRRGFDMLCQGIAQKKFDQVAAWSVDRLGRSLAGLVELLAEMQAKGVDLYLHQQGLDTSTPVGKAMFQMLGVFAEFERVNMAERIKSGIARARSQGKTLGRPRLSAETAKRIRAALDARPASRPGINAIASRLKVGSGTVHKIWKNMHKRNVGR